MSSEYEILTSWHEYWWTRTILYRAELDEKYKMNPSGSNRMERHNARIIQEFIEYIQSELEKETSGQG